MLGSGDPSSGFYDGRIMIIPNCLMSREEEPGCRLPRPRRRPCARLTGAETEGTDTGVQGAGWLVHSKVASPGTTVGVVAVSLLSKLRGFAPITVLLSSDLCLWSLPLTVNSVQRLQWLLIMLAYVSQCSPHGTSKTQLMIWTLSL